MSSSHPSLISSFTRSQFAALMATAVDFCTLIVLVEVGGVWYVAATASGALAGAVTNFMLGRHWSFRAADGGALGQATRYGLVSASSLLLNSLGVYFFTDYIGFKYTLSKVLTAALVGIFFNFPLHRRYVFKLESPEVPPTSQSVT